MEKPRITVHVPKEMADQIDRMAKELGTTKTYLGSLMMAIGLRTITDVDINQIRKDVEFLDGYTQDRKRNNS